ncbi:MAG: hypothetical protein OHK0029_30060 [Armatimonadaceae bacterium]
MQVKRKGNVAMWLFIAMMSMAMAAAYAQGRNRVCMDCNPVPAALPPTFVSSPLENNQSPL